MRCTDVSNIMLKFSKMHTKFSSGELHCDIPLDSPNHNLIITSQGYVFFSYIILKQSLSFIWLGQL